MNCIRCGGILPEEAGTCPNCGAVAGASDPTPAPEQVPEVPAFANAAVAVQGMSPQYQPGLWGPGMPPVSPPAWPQKKKAGLRVLLLVLIVLLLTGGGVGTGVYFATRPQPVIRLASDYTVGAISAGSTSTTFRVRGQKFSGNSDITVFLDGLPLPGGAPVQSDSDGNMAATLTVTGDWATGNHTITARDAAGYRTKAGVQIIVVVPGQAHTPGPNGAPSDDSSGHIVATNQFGDSMTLIVTGSPTGGTVCSERDDGRARSQTGMARGGITYIETTAYTCNGTYNGGRITYTETATSSTIQYSNGIHCSLHTPYRAMWVQGTFSHATYVSGTTSQDAVSVTCDHGVGTFTVDSSSGTWTGEWTTAN